MNDVLFFSWATYHHGGLASVWEEMEAPPAFRERVSSVGQAASCTSVPPCAVAIGDGASGLGPHELVCI